MANTEMKVVDCGPLSPEKASSVALAEGGISTRSTGVFGALGVHGVARDHAGGMTGGMICFPDAVHITQTHQAGGATGTGLGPVREAA